MSLVHRPPRLASKLRVVVGPTLHTFPLRVGVVSYYVVDFVLLQYHIVCQRFPWHIFGNRTHEHTQTTFCIHDAKSPVDV